MIPYTIEPRPDTGVNNVTLGVWLFLASEAMLFGALFSAYALLRTAAPVWPDARAELAIGVGLTHTLVLAGATACVWRALRHRSRTRWLLPASALALVFLVTKGFEYAGELERGLRPADSTFLATYFTFTALHALHVAAGLAGNVWAWAGAMHLPAALTEGRLRALGLYWVFVDVVWLIMFVLFYLA